MAETTTPTLADLKFARDEAVVAEVIAHCPYHRHQITADEYAAIHAAKLIAVREYLDALTARG